MVDEEEPFQDQEDASRAEESYEPSCEEEQLLPHKAIEATGEKQVGSNETEKAMAGGQTCRGFTASFLKGAAALLCFGALAGAMALLLHSRSSPAFMNGKNGLNEEETGHAGNSLAGSFKDKNVQGNQPTSIGHWQEPWEFTRYAFESALLHVTSARMSGLVWFDPMYKLASLPNYGGRRGTAKFCNASFPKYQIVTCSEGRTSGCLDEAKWISYSRLDAFVDKQIIPIDIEAPSTVLSNGAEIVHTVWLDNNQRPLQVREVERDRDFFVEASKNQAFGTEYFYDLLKKAYDYIKSTCYKAEGSAHRGYSGSCNGYQASITSVPYMAVQYSLERFDTCGYFRYQIVERNRTFFQSDFDYDGWFSTEHTALDVWYQQAKDTLDIMLEPITGLSIKDVEKKFEGLVRNVTNTHLKGEYTLVLTGYIDYYKHD